MTKWCPSDGGLLQYGPDPSLCFTETFLLFLVNIIFIIIMGGRLAILRRFPPFDYINIRNAKIILLVNVLAFAIAVFSIILAFVSISALSSIFYALSNAVIWFIIASTVGAESKRLARWPSVIIIVLLMINLICHSVLASVLYQEQGSSLFFLCASGSLICIFVILCISTLKDVFLSPEDVNEEELRRFSIEFTTSSPIRQQGFNDYFCNRFVEAVSMSFSGSSDAGRASASTVRRTRLDFTQSEQSWMNIWPFRASSTGFRNTDFQSLLEEDLMMDPEGDVDAFLQPNQYNNSSSTHRNSIRSSHSSILGGGSIVVGSNSFAGVNSGNFQQIESALDRSTQGNFVSFTGDKDRESTSGGISSYLFGSRSNSTVRKSSVSANAISHPHNSSTNTNNVSKINGSKRAESPSEWEQRDSDLSVRSGLGGRESSIGGGGSNTSRTGRVVAQVLEEHRARLAATTPILEPRGNELGVPGVASTSMRLDLDSFSSTLSGNNSNHGFGNGLGSDSASRQAAAAALLRSKRSLRVTVQRWGYRAKRGNMPKPTSTASNTLTNNSETEFEIITASAASSSATSRWAIWRTVSEIYRLHTTMVGLLGDFAPRRPALRSDSGKAQPNTSNTNLDMLEDQVDFNADMRALAVYFNALFRVEYHDNPHISVLLEFLSIPKDFLYPTNGAANSAGGGNGENKQGTTGDGSEHAGTAEHGENNTSGALTLAQTGHDDSSSSKLSPKGTGTNNATTPGGGAGGGGEISPVGGEKSLMDAAHKQQAEANQQEKWRKLMVQMKMKLKPRDIAVRCRLFEGVISGGDIASFLMRLNTNANITTTSSNPTPAAAMTSAASAAVHGSANTDTLSAVSNTTAPPTAGNASTTETYEVARDRFEACHIGQELLSCGLLLPICLGFAGDDDPHAHDDDYNFDKDIAEEEDSLLAASLKTTAGYMLGGAGSSKKNKVSVPSSAVATTSTITSSSTNMSSIETDPNSSNLSKDFPVTFSDLPGFVFRFPGKSGTAGKCALFGSNVTVRIPHMDFADDSDINRPVGRETMTLMVTDIGLPTNLLSSGTSGVDNSGIDSDHGAIPLGNAPVTGSSAPAQGSHVIYFLETTHGNDTWQVTRRYREFEQFSRALSKEGIRTDVPLPSKSYVTALAFMSRQAQLDETRRAGLEAYVSSALQAVIDSESKSAMVILAQFLDTEYHTLRIP